MTFRTQCNRCHKKIKIDIPFNYRRFRVHGAFTCNECVPENSPLRNGIEESFFTEKRPIVWTKTKGDFKIFGFGK